MSHGAAGGLGTALLQLGGLAGLETYGTASRHNHEFVSALGATPIDYHTEDFVERINELSGDGVDVGKRLPLTPNMIKYPQEHHAWYRETLTGLLASAAAGTITPVVAERIPLAEAARAHRLLERSGHAGKVVLTTDA